jgi:hypothetical protein
MNARIAMLSLCCCVLLSLAARPVHAALLISEVVYNELGSDTTGEWIEIFNSDPAAVDLTNYKIGDEETMNPPAVAESGGMWQFPAGAVIPAGGVQIVSVGSTRFFTVYGFNPTYEVLDNSGAVPNMINYTTWSNNSSPAINMANAGDQVLLLDSSDAIVDMISWGNSTFAFNPALSITGDGLGQERINAYVDTNAAADWQISNPPTPGTVPVPEPSSLALTAVMFLLAAATTVVRRRATG